MTTEVSIGLSGTTINHKFTVVGKKHGKWMVSQQLYRGGTLTYEGRAMFTPIELIGEPIINPWSAEDILRLCDDNKSSD